MVSLAPLPIPTADPAAVLFDQFRESIRTHIKTDTLREGIIGKDLIINGPVGARPLLYADYAASGRALRQIENFILEEVLPVYANPHTQASHCGRSINALRRRARQEIASFCGADESDAVIFAGTGATAALQKLAPLFGLNAVQSEKPLVLLGPYEHHSNLLPWRECGADVIELPEAETGGPDLDILENHLTSAGNRKVVCAFSAGSNVTGALTNIAAVSRLVKKYGQRIIWDFAGAAPYIAMSMRPAPDVHIDALAFSPHKFIGGPASSGILVVRRDAVVLAKPSAPGGGTVSFVSPDKHDYLPDIEAREEAGTPNVIADIRTALAMIVRDSLAEAGFDQHAATMCQNALSSWRANPHLEILGHEMKIQLPIISFRVRDTDGNLLHHQLITRILSDYFGIQARGGCACAGPYVHRLLNIDGETSETLRQSIQAGNELDKPGFVRVNFSPLMTKAEAAYLINAVNEIARNTPHYAPHFQGDPKTAIFHALA